MATKTKKTGVGEMKRADRRSSINILVLGDPGVGKSSLISTFVSRYFSQEVPGIMTKVRLPPDPGNSSITTIVDSQGGDAALISAVAALSLQTESSLQSFLERTNLTETSQAAADPPPAPPGMDPVDSIVLVYDLDRVETFFRLEQHWLPLIQRCYNGKVPVIVAENKMDLFRPSSSAAITDEQALARKRQQIVSLMQQFPFVRQCIKCSAKNLLRVDDVFLKAQQAVLYPFTPPLYDLETARLTAECKRALTRIFRIYDKDHDGLLSDAELDRFQRETYHVAVFDRDFAAWKKVVTRNAPDEVVLQNGKFTPAGFFAIFDVFISQNRLDVVWQALRKFYYDDDLNLHIPEEVLSGQSEQSDSATTSKKAWKLSSSSKKFLTALFHQFDADHDDRLTHEDLVQIFSILPPPALPPWHPSRASELFQGCFSVPKAPSRSLSSSPSDSPIPKGSSTDSTLIVPPMAQSLSNSGLSILSTSDSFPSIDDASGWTRNNNKSLSYHEWMGQWHVIAAVSPAVARSELFRLGHINSGETHKKRSRKKAASRELRVLVVGSSKAGKTCLLNALTGYEDSSVRPTTRPETSTAYCKVKRTLGSSGKAAKTSTLDDSDELVVHLVFTDVPAETLDRKDTAAALTKDDFDLAMLVFDCTQISSWNYVKELESSSALFTKETPRVFVGTKSDLLDASETEGDALLSLVVDAAEMHCRGLDLELPLLTTTVMLDEDRRATVLDHLARCALLEDEPGVPRLRSRPHEERREAARRRKIMWRIVSVGVVVAVGAIGFLWGKHQKESRSSRGRFGWLQSWFGGSSAEQVKIS